MLPLCFIHCNHLEPKLIAASCIDEGYKLLQPPFKLDFWSGIGLPILLIRKLLFNAAVTGKPIIRPVM